MTMFLLIPLIKQGQFCKIFNSKSLAKHLSIWLILISFCFQLSTRKSLKCTQLSALTWLNFQDPQLRTGKTTSVASKNVLHLIALMLIKKVFKINLSFNSFFQELLEISSYYLKIRIVWDIQILKIVLLVESSVSLISILL